MPYKNLESFLTKTDEKCVRDWILDLYAGSKGYVSYVLHLIEWGKAEGHWKSAQDMLLQWKRLRTAKNETARDEFVGVIHQYIRHKKDKHGHLTGTVDRKNCWAAVSNFFNFKHSIGKQPLPDLDDQEKDKLFRPSDADKQRVQFLGAMNVDEARLLIDNAPMPYKAALLIMLQAGFGGAEFEIFNESAWREVVKDPRNPKELKSGPHLKVLIFRSKTSRKELQKYYTFLSDDAKNLMDQWLKMRPQSDLPHLFIIRQKGRRKTATYAPVTTPLIENTVTRLAKRLNLLSPQELEIGRYHISPHKLRRVFEGLCLTHGVVEWTVEFLLGHKISRYNQVPWTQPDFVKKEYDKVEPWLNILSNPKGGVDEEKTKRTARVELTRHNLLISGYTEGEVDGLGDLLQLAPEKVRELIRAKSPTTAHNGGTAGGKQRVVPAGELKEWLERGWEYVAQLPGGDVIVRSVLA